MGQRRLGRVGRCVPAPWQWKGCRHGLYIEEKVGASEERSFGRMYRDGCFAFDWSVVLCGYLSGVVRYPPIGMSFGLGILILLAHVSSRAS